MTQYVIALKSTSAYSLEWWTWLKSIAGVSNISAHGRQQRRVLFDATPEGVATVREKAGDNYLLEPVREITLD